MTDIRIYGEIGTEVRVTDVADAVDAADGGPITLRVNSPGGDVAEGFAIMHRLREHPGAVTAVVEGMAASAASFIAVGGADRVVMRPASQLMVHDALSLIVGNQADLLRAAGDLDGRSADIAEVYAAKAGGTADEWRDLMRQETWYSAAEAVAAGLADEVADGRGAPAAVAHRSPVMASFRYGGRGEAPPPPTAPMGHNRKEHRMSALTELAEALDLTEEQITAAVRKAAVVDSVETSGTVEVSYPEDVTVSADDTAAVEPSAEVATESLTFAAEVDAEGWDADIAQDTGALTITAAEDAEPGDTATVTVTITGDGEPVTETVRVSVAAAEDAEGAADGDAEGTEGAEDAEDSAPATVTLDRDTYNDLTAAARFGWQAKADADAKDREAEVDGWIREGRMNPAHRAKAVALIHRDADTARDVYGANPVNTIPVGELGHGRYADPSDTSAARADLDKRAAAAFGSGPNLF